MDNASLLMYGFDLFGTVIFAITGAVKAVRLHLDILGVIVFATTVGCGGGMIRDVMIGATPVAAFTDSAYVIVCVATGLVVFFNAQKIVKRWDIILYCDAIGLGVFTALGVGKAAQMGLGWVGQMLSGVFTAVGGGVIRDVMSKSVPVVLTSDFYATASIIGALVLIFAVEPLGLPAWVGFTVCTVVVVCLRVFAIINHMHLPVAKVSLPNEDDYHRFHGHAVRHNPPKAPEAKDTDR